jgi:L-ornithine N5-oxygenase
VTGDPSPSEAACYLQGVNEATHGIADSLLSVAAHRAADITADLLAHRAGAGDPRPLATRGAEPR